MTWDTLEKMFNRALGHAFSRRKLLYVFPVTALCGLITAICRIVSQGSGDWVGLSLAFLPIFVCAGIFLALGVLLTRVYHHEVKGISVNYFEILKGARSLLLGISYIAVPLIFAYLVLWMGLGVFYLLRAIPVVGHIVGSVFSFGPFLLVLGSLLLGVSAVLLLFYVTPSVALSSDIRPQVAEKVVEQIKQNPFQSIALPLLGLIPLLIAAGLLSLAAVVTGIVYIDAPSGFALAFKWLFMMIPFCALLTPTIIFFFNFAAESHAFCRRIAKAP
jgi:hypothetical protein